MPTISTLITPIYAALLLRVGKVIAYPTEAVYGLGCDPFNERAVAELLQLKQRPAAKGLILLAASWDKVEFLVDKNKVPEVNLQKALSTWPGAITWVFPASFAVPPWIRGEHDTIALRVTAHPVARAICENFDCPIVSTSANISALPPARIHSELVQQFGDKLEFVVAGEIGEEGKPTSIYDVLTGDVLCN